MQNLMPPVNTPDKLFHDGDPTTGVEGTIVTAEFLNNDQSAIRDTQQELINVLAAATMSPDESKQNQLVTAIKSLIDSAVSKAKYIPDVGELYLSKNKTDPNIKWPGTTWEYLGAGLTLRTAKADLSDLATTVGADTVALTTANLPSHTHGFSATTGAYDYAAINTSNQAAANVTSSAYDYAPVTTSSFNHGTKTTNTTGAHTHGYISQTSSGTRGDFDADGARGTVQTSSAGNHSHTVDIGAHSHSVDLPSHTHTVTVPAHSHSVDLPSHTHSVSGTTSATGTGSSFSLVNKSLLIAVWARTA